MTHLLFRACVVVLSLVTSRWAAAVAARSARFDAFFHSSPARLAAVTRRILLSESAFPTHLVVSRSWFVKQIHCL